MFHECRNWRKTKQNKIGEAPGGEDEKKKHRSKRKGIKSVRFLHDCKYISF